MQNAWKVENLSEFGTKIENISGHLKVPRGVYLAKPLKTNKSHASASLRCFSIQAHKAHLFYLVPCTKVNSS